VLKLDYVTPPSLSFATSSVGVQSSDSPQSFTLTNAGNAALSFPIPGTGNNPSISTGFTLDSATTCPQLDSSSGTAGSLAANTSCSYAVDFIPQAVGANSGQMVATDTNLNAASPTYATQTISLSGTGLKTAQTITFPNPGAQVYGTSPVLTATATSGLTVTFSSATPGVCTITTGGALTTVSVGSCIIDANQPGDATYAAATQVSQSFSITQAATTTTLGVSSTSINPGQSVTLTATVASTTTGTPTGTVSFYSGTTLLGASTLASGVATLTTTALSAGATNAITASYGGNTDFMTSSTTASIGIVVAPLDFTFSFTGQMTQTVVPGSSVIYQASITPLYGSYAGTVNFTVTGLPAGATYTVTPATVPANTGQRTVLLTIQTAATTALERNTLPLARKLAPLSLALLLPLFGFGDIRRRGRKLSRMLCLLLLVGGLAATAAISGCGSGSGNGSQKTYNVNVTATAGGIQHTAAVKLEIK